MYVLACVFSEVLSTQGHSSVGWLHFLLLSVFPCAVEVPEGRLIPSLLDSSGVYVLDCGADIFVWYVGTHARAPHSPPTTPVAPYWGV